MGREGLTSICILELLADGHGEWTEPWMLQPVPGLTENGDVQQAADLQFLLCILLFQGPVGDMWGREIPFASCLSWHTRKQSQAAFGFLWAATRKGKLALESPGEAIT